MKLLKEKNAKVTIELHVDTDGFVVCKFVKHRRTDDYFSFTEFDTALKNGRTFGFEKKEIQDFLDQHSSEIKDLKNKAQERASYSVRWNELALYYAKERGDSERVYELEHQISQRIMNF